MAKLQIKSEKPLFFGGFFSGRGANPLTLTLTVQNYVPYRRKLSFHTRKTKFMHGKTSIIL